MNSDFQQLQDEYWNKDQSKRRSPYHPCVRALFEPRAKYLQSISDDAKDSILEIGSGNGYLSVYLEEKFNDVLASDLSEEMLKHNPCKNKLKASATDLPLEDDSFDIVTCSHLLHHLNDNDKKKALNEMRRVSRNKVVVYEPHRNNPFNFLFGLIVKEERESLKFSKTYLKTLFMNTGLKIENIMIEGCILPNKAPKSWIPIGKYLDKTFFRNLGFYIRATAQV
jgi:ubiquinone/menaquinone biosynthesis C-methylase UbiE